MPVTIILRTVVNELNYYNLNVAQRYEQVAKTVSDNSGISFSNPTPRITTTYSLELRDNNDLQHIGDKATLVFNRVPPGAYRFCIRNADKTKMKWKSRLLTVETGNEQFDFTVYRIPETETTFRGRDFRKYLPRKKITMNIDKGVDEKLIINNIDILVHADHIELKGFGKVTKENQRSLLESNMDFSYKFNMVTRNSIQNNPMLDIVPFGATPLELKFSNLITGLAAGTFTAKAADILLKLLDDKINEAIKEQFQQQITAKYGADDLAKLISTNIVKVELVVSPKKRVPASLLPRHNTIRILVDVSIPTALT